MPIDHHHVALNVRIARVAHGLTQRELADLVGCRQALISATELGLRPTPQLLERLASALGVEVAVLLRPSRARLVQGGRDAAA